MLDMGFRPAVNRIVKACPNSRQTLFFSATLDGEAGRAAGIHHDPGHARARALGAPRRGRGRAPLRPRQRRGPRGGPDRRARARPGPRPGLRPHQARRRPSGQAPGAHGVNAVAMHGNKSQRQREVALSRFESGSVDTLVATDVAARGIDVTGISHVINFDPPGDHETYVHRIGRTARAGRSGIGITLVDGSERAEVVRMAGQLGIEHGLGIRRRPWWLSTRRRYQRPRSGGGSRQEPRPGGRGRRPRSSGDGGQASPPAADRGGPPRPQRRSDVTAARPRRNPVEPDRTRPAGNTPGRPIPAGYAAGGACIS